MSIINNTVGITEITPVESEVTKTKKQESRDFSRGGFKTKVHSGKIKPESTKSERTSKQQGKISGDLRS